MNTQHKTADHPADQSTSTRNRSRAHGAHACIFSGNLGDIGLDQICLGEGLPSERRSRSLAPLISPHHRTSGSIPPCRTTYKAEPAYPDVHVSFNATRR